MKELLKNVKFRWLLVALIIIIPFLVLSYFSIHAALWIELPIFLAIIRPSYPLQVDTSIDVRLDTLGIILAVSA